MGSLYHQRLPSHILTLLTLQLFRFHDPVQKFSTIHKSHEDDKSYLHNGSFSGTEADDLMYLPQQFPMCYSIGHSDALTPAAMITSRTSDDCMDWIAVTDGVVDALDEQASSTLTTTET